MAKSIGAGILALWFVWCVAFCCFGLVVCVVLLPVGRMVLLWFEVASACSKKVTKTHHGCACAETMMQESRSKDHDGRWKQIPMND